MNSDDTNNSKAQSKKYGAYTISSDEEQFIRLLKTLFQYFEHSGEALIDSGAIYSFISCRFIHKFRLIVLSTSPLQVTFADRSIVECNSLVSVSLQFGTDKSQLTTNMLPNLDCYRNCTQNVSLVWIGCSNATQQSIGKH